MYDGLVFSFAYVCERDEPLTSTQAEKEAQYLVVHEHTGEELTFIDVKEISKEEYEIFRKYHL